MLQAGRSFYGLVLSDFKEVVGSGFSVMDVWMNEVEGFGSYEMEEGESRRDLEGKK